MTSVSLSALAERSWDVVVIGAGPAGAMAARELALRGARVLLVDKATFPRAKVCGCCLSGAALAELEAVSLGELVRELGAVRVQELRLFIDGRSARISLPHSAALSREAFDAALVEQAVYCGVTFIDGTVARLDGMQLSLRHGSESASVNARVMIAADGLSGTSLQKETPFKKCAARYSLMGMNAMVDDVPADYEPGTIFMACGRGGYVGLVRLENGRLDIAAALDADFVRAMHGPGVAVAEILRSSDLPPIENSDRAEWHGTPYMTRAPKRLVRPGLFVIGDAAGYIEPFTGEGIAWALVSGRAVADIAERAIHGWRTELGDEWTRLHHQLFARRQRVCRWITLSLRQPTLTRLAVRVLSCWPSLADPLVDYIHRPFGRGDTWRGKSICQPV